MRSLVLLLRCVPGLARAEARIGGAVGAGIGFDEVWRRHYDVTGGYSYTDRNTLVSMNVQLALDLHTTAYGTKLGVLAGFGVFH